MHSTRLSPDNDGSLVLFEGGTALSAFRMDRLNERLGAIGPQITCLKATYVYFVAAAKSGQIGQLDHLLADLLQARPGVMEVNRRSLLVIPRLGTVSPWSSKATDILWNCGLHDVARVERGILYGLSIDGDHPEARVLLHDRMTQTVLDSLDEIGAMFNRGLPRPVREVPLATQGRTAIERADTELGLALVADEIEYIHDYFRRVDRQPTDVELMMFAQINSEHCRHKIFNASWSIDGEPRAASLFDMIRHTHRCHPQGTISAYRDNAAIIRANIASAFYPNPQTRVYEPHRARCHLVIKAETHNHPTAIAPHPGAATGAGGEIRDEAATGRGAKPKAGFCGFTVSNLEIPGAVQPWEVPYGKPDRLAGALDIMVEAPIGAAAFNNEFGRASLAGYFRTFQQAVDGRVWGYHKPIMLAGGVGTIDEAQVDKSTAADAAIVQIGGPALLIGLGGGAASSMQAGSNLADLDFNSVQRDNPQMQRRCQEVIDRCWQMGIANPILSIHDVGAGGLCNAVPELLDGARAGGRVDLRQVPSGDPSLSPLELWCNEAQERYLLLVASERLEEFLGLCRDERCPVAVLGTLTDEPRLIVDDGHFENRPIDMDLASLLGKPPRMHRIAQTRPVASLPFDHSSIEVADAIERVLRLPTVGDKRFLITIGDRTVGGLVCRDQLVGPWQVAVSDVAVTCATFDGYAGEAVAIGERTPLALLDSAAAARMAVGECLTNIAAAAISGLAGVKLCANWMAAAGEAGQDAALYRAVAAVGLELCPRLGISIPVGKDSLSMRSAWIDGDEQKSVTAPVSVIVSAFSPVTDVRWTLTPWLEPGVASQLLLIDLGGGKDRLGGSCLAQVYGQSGTHPPDLDDPERMKAFMAFIERARERGLVRAYHDRSDGGLFVAAAEMAFASRRGLDIRLNSRDPISALFAEELGAVVQVADADRDRVFELARRCGLADCVTVVGWPTDDGMLSISSQGRLLYRASVKHLHRLWSSTAYEIQRRRDNPACAQAEYDLIDREDPGLQAEVRFRIDAPAVSPRSQVRRPRVAILREQGVNGQVEMAAAFHRAGFEAVDVHMSDLLAARIRLDSFSGLAACGGFSHGDVLGAGKGWAAGILHHPLLRVQFETFFHRKDTFGLGVCNGCQMMSQLRDLIPGARHWPGFLRNESEQFEGRLVVVRIEESPSILLKGMAGSRLPVAVAHGEGRVGEYEDADTTGLVTMRYLDNGGAVTQRYPYNPSGSIAGISGITTADGRFTIMMPHPERMFRSVQHSWHPAHWQEDGPWLQLFLNAREWVRQSPSF